MAYGEYVEYGLKLCRIEPGTKRPMGAGWNKPDSALTAGEAEQARGVGLMHLYSGTCALDIDHMDSARAMLANVGVDLDALLDAPDAVKIDSGREGRAKLLFRTHEPLGSMRKANGHGVAYELRCATANGTSLQDVLPGAVHPDTGKQYEWDFGLVGDWRAIPELPPELLAHWKDAAPFKRDVSEKIDAPTADPDEHDFENARRLLAATDPSTGYEQWIRIGMALHHTLGPDGFKLWREWSEKGDNFKSVDDLVGHWRSFGNHATPVTLDMVSRGTPALPKDFDETSEFDEVLDRQSRIMFYTMADLVKQPWPSWIIRHWLPQAELTMVYGQSGAGKSFAVLSMALAVARGEPWMGNKVRQGTVLWLAAEAFGSMRARTRAYQIQHGMDDSEFAALPFYSVEGADLGDVSYIQELVRGIQDRGVDMVIVDTLAASSSGADENSGADMNAILGNCREIYRQTHANVVLIHHSGKDETKGARGWSGIKAAVQAELQVTNDEGYREIVVRKQRDGTEGLTQPFTLCNVRVGMDDEGQEINSAYVEECERASADEVRNNDGLTPRERMVAGIVEDMAGSDGVARTKVMEAVLNAAYTSSSGRSRGRASVDSAIVSLMVKRVVRQEVIDGDQVLFSVDEDADFDNE